MRTELAEGTVIEMRLGAPISEARCLLPVDEGMVLEWVHHGLWESFGACKDRSKMPEDWRLIGLGDHWSSIDSVELERGGVSYYYASIHNRAKLKLDTGCEIKGRFSMRAEDRKTDVPPLPATWDGEFYREFYWDVEDPACAELEVSPDAEYGYQCADTYKMTATVVED